MGFKKPNKSLNSVDFPLPLGPMRAVTDFSGILRVILRMAGWDPNDLHKSIVENMVAYQANMNCVALPGIHGAV